MLPDGFDYLSKSVLGRAQQRGKIKVVIHNLRDYTIDNYKTVDDRPYGGGVGLVMKVDVAFRALASVILRERATEESNIRSFASAQDDISISYPPATPSRSDGGRGKLKPKTRILLVTPQGKPFTQKDAERFAKKYDRIIILAGRFEGYDERIRKLVDEEISIGDYILTGGELPAMAIVDAVSRLIPGVLGKDESSHHESFTEGLLEYPQYTRPEKFCHEVRPKRGRTSRAQRGSTSKGRTISKCLSVPPILKSGHHAQIANWRKQQAEKRTRNRRPDLWAKYKIK